MSWESSARPPFDLYFETDARFADDFAAEPEAFLVACFIPAIHHGESRVFVEGALCPRLAEGVQVAAALLRSWYGPPNRPVAIEASNGIRALTPRRPSRSAFYLTGGIDSSYLLHANRTLYPLDHPASFSDCLSIHGNIRAESPNSPWNARALAVLAKTAERNRLELIPVRMNLWDLDPDLLLVRRQSLSSALAAAAHLFRRRWTAVSIASGLDIGSEIARGTHPLLDPLYSTSAVEIRYDPCRLGRFERVRILAANGDDAVENLIVCLTYPGPPNVNCGECEKCVRTMTQLLAVGRLSRVRTFRHEDVSVEMIRAIPIAPFEVPYWDGTAAALLERGRTDLAAAVESKLAETRRLDRWATDAGWKGRLRRLDRRLLGGRLLELRRRWGSPGH